MHRRFGWLPAVMFVVLISLACAVPLNGQDAAEAHNGAFETRSLTDIAYYDGPDADPVRHKLDVYLPKGRRDFPVLMFIHGGAWVEGSKNQLFVYSTLARTFNKHGIAVVCPNYRLSPRVRHPEHIRDVARAVAWVHRNIGKYGGRADEIFVSGHSAGGHLCSLLATDSRYLKEAGVPAANIRGCLPLSGLFVIPRDKFFDLAFGKDLTVRAQASPITHVRQDTPPFLVMLGDNDLPACDRPQADAFCKACQTCGAAVDLLEVPRRNHFSILLNAISDTDVVTRSMLSFITTQVALHRLQERGVEGIDVIAESLGRYAAR
ncbi:MAG: alpha/beta hydrolase [Planctomycetes bacterium]|nr:alpha/beta hydrolase [Planctomycetota bacterium]